QHGKKSRQFHTKHRAATLSVVARNFAAVLLHDAEADAQPESGAFSNRLGSIERIENSVGLLNAGSGISKEHHYTTAISHGLNGQHAATSVHRIHGVTDDIKEYLNQLIPIAAHARKYGLKLQFNFDIG